MNSTKQIYITKSDGVREVFDPVKLERSLLKLGTKPETVGLIVSEVLAKLRDGQSTHDIYQQAFRLLREHQRSVAVRYSLKRVIAELGPSGFPFEKLVAEIFKAQGYEAVTDQIVLGRCVPHEMDIMAWKDKELIMTEAKFHTDLSLKSDLKVALYIKARFEDLQNSIFSYGNIERKLTKGILITNTNFSTTAIQYGECAKLNMIGWNYPKGNNLHHMIEGLNLIPVTALTSLDQIEKKMLIDKGVVLSKQVLEPSVLSGIGLSEEKIKDVANEVQSLIDICK